MSTPALVDEGLTSAIGRIAKGHGLAKESELLSEPLIFLSQALRLRMQRGCPGLATSDLVTEVKAGDGTEPLMRRSCTTTT